MANKNVIPVFIVIISGLSLVIVLPNIFFSSSLSSYGTISKSESFTFPENLSPKVDLNINADVGDIKIEYVEPSPDTYGKIDINFEICGSDIAGKSYPDYFMLDWQTTNSSANFTLELLSDDWFDPSLWSMKNVSIIVSLRSDITFDIMAIIDDGEFEISVPWGVSIGNLFTNVSKGNIIYDFEHCTIEGNLTGYVNEGDIFFDFDHCTIEDNITGIVDIGTIELKTFNTKYTENCNWNFTVENGDIFLNISQFMDLGANITGLAEINDGYVYFFYEDDTPYVGAIFKIPFWSHLPFYDLNNVPSCLWSGLETCPLEGFEYQLPNPDLDEEGIIEFTSDDLLANNVNSFYDITFEIYQGSFNFDLTSFPDLDLT